MSIATLKQGTNTSNTGWLLNNLSNSEKNDIKNTLNAMDLELLSQRQKKLFEDIKKLDTTTPEDYEDRLLLLTRLFEHSVEDGFKLAQQLKLIPKEYAEIIQNRNFIAKHPEIVRRIIGIVGTKKIKEIMKADSKLAWNILFHCVHILDAIQKDNNPWITQLRPCSSPIASKLLTEMDDIFSQYLRIREFKAEHPDDKRTAGERLAENLFIDVQHAGKYHKTRIIDALYDNLVKNLFPAKDEYYSSKEKKVFKLFKELGINTIAANIQSNEYIEPKILTDIINIIKTNPNNFNYDEKIVAEKIQKDLKDAIYKPMNLTFHMKNYLAEKQNKAELEILLQQHFKDQREKTVKLVYDAKEWAYKVENIKDENNNNWIWVWPKANLEKSVDMSGVSKVEDAKIIKGKMMFKIRNGLKRRLADETGVISWFSWYDEIGDFAEVGDMLRFAAKKNWIRSIIVENGKFANFPIGTSIEKIIDFKGTTVLVIKDKHGEYLTLPWRNFSTKTAPYHHIKSIDIVDNELTYTTADELWKCRIRKWNTSLWRFAAISYIGDTNSPYTWVVNKDWKRYGIDKNRNEKEWKYDDIVWNPKGKAVYKTQAGTAAKKRYIATNKGDKISNRFEELYGPREHNGQTIFIGKNGNEFERRVVDTTNTISDKVNVEKTMGLGGADKIETPKIINGKIYARLHIGFLGWRFLQDETNHIIWNWKPYDEIGDYTNIWWKIHFFAKEWWVWKLIDEDWGEAPFRKGVIPEKIIEFDGMRVVTTKEWNNTMSIYFQNGEWWRTYKETRDLQIIDDNLIFINEELSGEWYINKKKPWKGFPERKWPYDAISYIGNERDWPNIWIAKKWLKLYGIDKNRKETEWDFRLYWPIKEIKFTKQQNPITKKYSLRNKKSECLSDQYDEIIGPREENGQKVYIGKRDNKLEKLVIRTQGDTVNLEKNQEEKLDLLNLCVPFQERPWDLEEYKNKIENYFSQKIKDNEEYRKSIWFLAFLRDTIKQVPKIFIDTIAAKKDKNEELIAENICRKIFPEAFIQEGKTDKENSLYRGINKIWRKSKKADPVDYLSKHTEDSMSWGDPLEIPKEILKIRGKINDILACSLYGACDENGVWKQVYFPIDINISGQGKITTISIPHIKQNTSIVLAKPINANILPERVKWISKSGKEINLETTTNALNESIVIVDDKNIKEIVYSIEQSTLPQKIQNISNTEYDQFKKQFVRMYGDEEKRETPLLKPIAQLDEEELMFLDSIKNETPKQKLIKIEQYVRQHSFYDRNNKEVEEYKTEKSIDERMYVSQKRIEELIEKNPGLVSDLENKKRAGVCADFANITAAMLRKAWFLSGVINGFMPDGSTVNTSNAHGVAYAIFPNEKGKNQIIIIDGTPHGSGYDHPSLQEQETIIAQYEEQIKKEIEQRLEEITSVLESGDKEAIDKLLAETFNGNLEDLLNITLKKELRTNHYLHLQNLLNVYRYSPLKDSNISSPENQSFIQEEMKKDDSDIKIEYRQEAKAGTLFFDMIRLFIDRFTKTSGEKNKAFDRLDNIIDTCKDLLNDIEYKSIKIIIKYLKAENIKGKK